MLLLDEIVKRGLLKEEQVSEVVKIAKIKYEGNIEQALVNYDSRIDEEKILEIKGEIFGVPIKKVNVKSVLPATLKLIPIDVAKSYKFVPINLTNDFLEVGIVDPENIQAVDALTFILSKFDKPFKLFLISASVFTKLIERYEGVSNSEVDQALNELDSEIAQVNSGVIKIDQNTKNPGSS
jgi:hypothetical protein